MADIWIRFFLAPILWPASLLYAIGLKLHQSASLKKKIQLPVPVISVGNLTVGGTGKTPVLMKLAQDIQHMGRRPFVLTRGYRGAFHGPQSGFVFHTKDAVSFSDEVQLMAEKLNGIPLGIGPDRISSANRILESGSFDTALLDDGFQHWKIDRQLDIVCIDATDPWGGGGLLPFGRMREPASALQRSHLILLTRCEAVSVERISNLKYELQKMNQVAPIVALSFQIRLDHQGGEPIQQTPQRALAVSGIGNPDAFENALKNLNIQIIPLRFADHHPYSAADIERILRKSDRKKAPIITTEKDWVKWRNLKWDKQPDLIIARQSIYMDESEQKAWSQALEKVFISR